MKNFKPDLELLKRAFGNHIQGCHAELIKIPHAWSCVYRVTLAAQGHAHPKKVVIKGIDPDGPPSSIEAEREVYFYQSLHAGLCVPKPEIYHLTTDRATGFYVIVMQDLSSTHRFPVHPYQWNHQEMGSVLQAYAQLHSSKVQLLDHHWLLPRHESLLEFEQIPEQVSIVQQAGIWGGLPELPDLIACARESCQKYVGEKMSLLHGDTTPANAALPQDLSQPATLIDWQDVGIGMPEFDLAYLDLQPFESARVVPRPELLDLYWQFRAKIDSGIPSPEERCARQQHADLVMALRLVGSASRVALHPFPVGTYPHAHWVSDYKIVYNRLRSLAQEI